MNHAIEKFENAKRSIENEIVYENPMLFVNVCNMLGNCYLTLARSATKVEAGPLLSSALDNFESSLCLINRIEPEGIPSNMVGKICLNIALIRAELGFHEEAVIMN